MKKNEFGDGVVFKKLIGHEVSYKYQNDVLIGLN